MASTTVRQRGYQVAINAWQETFQNHIIQIGQDRIYAGPGQVPTYDWQLPAVPIVQRNQNRWHEDGHLTDALLGQDRIYSAPGEAPTYDWQLPVVPLVRRNENRWHEDGHLTDVLRGQDKIYGAPGEAPAYDWQLPVVPLVQRHQNRTHIDNHLQNTLVGQDQFYDGPGKVPTFDWQLPTPSRVLEICLRTWIDGHLNNTLRGQDVIFGAPGQVPTYDWQLPTPGQPRRHENRSWLDFHNLNTLVGQDRFFAGPGQVPTFDWQLPVPSYPRAISLRTWNDSHLHDLMQLVVDDYKGRTSLAANRRSNLARYVSVWADCYTNITATTLQLVFVQPPLNVYDTSNPVPSRQFAIDLRSFADSHLHNTLFLNLPGGDQFTDAPSRIPLPRDWSYYYNNQENTLQPSATQPQFSGEFNMPVRFIPRAVIFDTLNMLTESLQQPKIQSEFMMPVRKTVQPLVIDVADILNTLFAGSPPPGAAEYIDQYLRMRQPDRLKIDGQSLNLSTLAGQDRMYGAPGQVPEYTWVVVPARLNRPPLSSWNWGPIPTLVGQDSIYGAPGQVPAYDWQNPRGYRRALVIEEYMALVNLLLGVPTTIAARRGRIEITDYSVGNSDATDRPQGRIAIS